MLLKKGNTWFNGTDMTITQDDIPHVREMGGKFDYSITHYGSTIVFGDSGTRVLLNNPETPNSKSSLLEILRVHFRLLGLGAFNKIQRPHDAQVSHIKQIFYDLNIQLVHDTERFEPIVFSGGEWSFDHGVYRYTVERRYSTGWFTKVTRTFLEHTIKDRNFPEGGHLKIGDVQSKTYYSTQVGPITQDKALSYFGIPECESTL